MQVTPIRENRFQPIAPLPDCIWIAVRGNLVCKGPFLSTKGVRSSRLIVKAVQLVVVEVYQTVAFCPVGFQQFRYFTQTAADLIRLCLAQPAQLQLLA